MNREERGANKREMAGVRHCSTIHLQINHYLGRIKKKLKVEHSSVGQCLKKTFKVKV